MTDRRLGVLPVALALFLVLGGGIAAALTLGSGEVGADTAGPRPSAPEPQRTAPSPPPSSPSPSSPSATSPPASSTPAEVASLDPADAAIAAAILTPPPSFEPVQDAGVASGPIDLATAARLDGGGRLSATGLQSLGFERGFARQWQGPDGVLVVLAYRFDSAPGAAAYVRTARQVRAESGTYTVGRTQRVPNGALFTTTTGAGPTAVVLFAEGRTAYAVGLVGPPGSNLPEVTSRAELLAGTQYDAAR